ncbi:MAG: hypothetical protein K2F83_03925 [Oscillospiraceae bacterium]|nr:hypothetical protein [Oscillospiraceae bacterium]
MSTNKTPNYALHSWVPTDEFHLTEINENFALLDAALKAEAGSREALLPLLGERVRMVTGSYAGSCHQTSSVPQEDQPIQPIDLGFRPRAVVVMNQCLGISGSVMYFLAVDNVTTNNAVILTETGFAVTNILRNGAYMNYVPVYHYAAFY